MELIKPIAEVIREPNVKADYKQADETYLEVQVGCKGAQMEQGYLWGLLGPAGVYFQYDPSRSSEVAKGRLEGSKGFVQTDAYVGYNPVFVPEGVKRIGCWAHVRRKFVEVPSISGKEATAVLKKIAEL